MLAPLFPLFLFLPQLQFCRSKGVTIENADNVGVKWRLYPNINSEHFLMEVEEKFQLQSVDFDEVQFAQGDNVTTFLSYCLIPSSLKIPLLLAL